MGHATVKAHAMMPDALVVNYAEWAYASTIHASVWNVEKQASAERASRLWQGKDALEMPIQPHRYQ